MRILNTSGREQSIAGVGTWPVDGTFDVFDPDVAEGILRNPYFELAEDQPEDVDPVEAETMSVEERVALAQQLVAEQAPPIQESEEELPREETPVTQEETAPPTTEVKEETVRPTRFRP